MIATIGVLLVILPLFPALRYFGEDPISRAGLNTEYKLAAYERTGNPKEIRNWIINGPTDALRQQIYITLGEWSIKHQNEFIRLVESLNAKQRRNFVDTFAFVLDNSGKSKRFMYAYRSIGSETISKITRKLGRSASWSDYSRKVLKLIDAQMKVLSGIQASGSAGGY